MTVINPGPLVRLRWLITVFVLAAGQNAWAADDEAAEKDTREIQATIQEQLDQENEALQQLTVETVDLDRQVEAVTELIMMKNDLEVLKREHSGIAITDEVARAQLEDAKAIIVQSAEKVQSARTNREIERAMQLAKEKIEAIKSQISLAEHSVQDREKAQTQLTSELIGMTDFLQSMRKTYRRQLGGDEKITRQLDKLAIDLGALRAKLKSLTKPEEVQEVALAIDAVREKIDILQSKLRFMGRTDMPVRQMQQSMARLDSVIDAPAEHMEDENDIFLTQPLERIRAVQVFNNFRDKVVSLFFNSLRFFWTDAASGVNFIGRLLLIVMGMVLVNSVLIWRKH